MTGLIILSQTDPLPQSCGGCCAARCCGHCSGFGLHPTGSGSKCPGTYLGDCGEPMMAGSHVALGIAAWLVAAPHLGLPAAAPACLGLAVLGALLPDVDHPKSWLGKRVRPLSTTVASVLGHRGITHSAVAVVVCAWALLHSGAPRLVVDPVAVGYLSHLAADMLTPQGLRLTWPLRRTWALPLCKSGSPFEPLIVALLLFWAGSGTLVPPLLRDVWSQSGLEWRVPPHGDTSRQPKAVDKRSR